VNVPALRHAQQLIEAEQAEVTEEFKALTNLNPTQREAVRLLVGLPDMRAETLEAAEIADPTKARIVELYSRLSYAAAKKVRTMLDCACDDEAIRGGHLYYGAGTGRLERTAGPAAEFQEDAGMDEAPHRPDLRRRSE
jgi:hypothetical protein